ncbi:MAG: hypothetical protein VX777_07365 [Chlamydiota bacterium]|nr:hypothetical protein [Chlamydiota bacterium]
MKTKLYLTSAIYSTVGLGMLAETLVRLPERYLRNKTDESIQNLTAAILYTFPLVNVYTLNVSYDQNLDVCLMEGADTSVIQCAFKNTLLPLLWPVKTY